MFQTSDLYSRIKNASPLYETFVIYRYQAPLQNYNFDIIYSINFGNISDNENLLNNDIPKFAFYLPLHHNIKSTEYPHDISNHIFCLTDIDGYLLFGYCLNWIRTDENLCMVLLTHKPWHNAFEKLLDHIYKYSLYTDISNLELLIKSLFDHYPSNRFDLNINGAYYQTYVNDQYFNLNCTKKGFKDLEIKFYNVNYSDMVCDSPFDEYHKFVSVPESIVATELYKCLSVRHIVSLWKHILNERRILLVSESLTRVSRTACVAIALLYPMYWQHIFVPYLPPTMVETLSAPMPYLIGITKNLFDEYVNTNNRLKVCSLSSSNNSCSDLKLSNGPPFALNAAAAFFENNNQGSSINGGSNANKKISSQNSVDPLFTSSGSAITDNNCVYVYDLDRDTVSYLQDLTLNEIKYCTAQDDDFPENLRQNYSLDIPSSITTTITTTNQNQFNLSTIENGAGGTLPIPTYVENLIIQKLSKLQTDKPSEKAIIIPPTNTLFLNSSQQPNAEDSPVFGNTTKSTLQIPIGYAFFKALIDVTGHYRSGLKFEPGHLIAFETASFLKSSRPSLRPCLDGLVKTQMFNQFITERLHRLNGGLGFDDTFEKHLNDKLHVTNFNEMSEDPTSALQKYKNWMNIMKNESDFYLSLLKRKTNRVFIDKTDTTVSSMKRVASALSSKFTAFQLNGGGSSSSTATEIVDTIPTTAVNKLVEQFSSNIPSSARSTSPTKSNSLGSESSTSSSNSLTGISRFKTAKFYTVIEPPSCQETLSLDSGILPGPIIATRNDSESSYVDETTRDSNSNVQNNLVAHQQQLVINGGGSFHGNGVSSNGLDTDYDCSIDSAFSSPPNLPIHRFSSSKLNNFEHQDIFNNNYNIDANFPILKHKNLVLPTATIIGSLPPSRKFSNRACRNRDSLIDLDQEVKGPDLFSLFVEPLRAEESQTPDSQFCHDILKASSSSTTEDILNDLNALFQTSHSAQNGWHHQVLGSPPRPSSNHVKSVIPTTITRCNTNALGSRDWQKFD